MKEIIIYTFCTIAKFRDINFLRYLRDHFRRAFQEYHKKNKRLPIEVVVYRSGTSEGEFAEVENEANDIRALAEKMTELNGGRPYRPKITIIVAQTNSNYRIMPASMPPANGGRMRASDYNVPSGTCADTGITHPRLREFIMTSQQANIGTSRPTRYTIVVEDKPQMSLTDAEHITHFLSHGHQQSTLPTHVPAVLYAAENLAKRGRAAWKTKL
ncbi:piwi domain protein [Teladorsagia circumcincta]|uniref:Piwi domain protein n=1 Tax=Teladorsagia circumcincta TaxID=45464 RepID=A0A2G9T6I8_TELCI|nr:piwi domain protein [Teladorsagia circumcincta]